ncbi:Fatty acid hydroxylase [Lotmaria passim]
MKASKSRVRIPPIHKLRPTWTSTALHAFVYLARNALLSSIVAVCVFQPLFRWLVLDSGLAQFLPTHVLFTFVFAWVCHSVPWFVFNSVYLFLDSIHPQLGTNKYKDNPLIVPLARWAAKYRLPRQPQQLPTPTLVWRTVVQAMIDQYIIVPVALLATLMHTGACELRVPPPETSIVGFSTQEISEYWQGQHLGRLCFSIATLMVHFLLANMINEVGFYTAHGALHSNPTLYRVFHKKHHMYIGTIGIAAEYASPVEEILANAIPTVAYFAIMFFSFTRGAAAESAFVTTARAWPLFMTWMWARLWETYETHSGYCFADSWMGKMGLMHGHRARFHDFHHTHNVSNYGAGLFMDAILNTMDPYLIHRYPDKCPAAATPEEEEAKAQRELEEATEALQRAK